MVLEMAEARGQVSIRPWRVGVLVDIRDSAAVRTAIAQLSSVWGGASMPIFDFEASIVDLERAGTVFDVDALYADVQEGPLAEFLRSAGWGWRGRGPWGPFGSEEGGWFRKGLLPVDALLSDEASLLLPTWERDDPADLALAATWGVLEGSQSRGRPVPYQDLLEVEPGQAVIGSLEAGMLHIENSRLNPRALASSILVLRPDYPQDAVAFWNLRAHGERVIGVPASGDPYLVRWLLSQPLLSQGLRGPDAVHGSGFLDVSGLQHASTEVARIIADAADREALDIRTREWEAMPEELFPGIETQFTKSIRANFRPESRFVDVDLPRLPLASNRTFKLARGIVAAEIGFREVQGQDPRVTASIPPYRRHSVLVERAGLDPKVDHVRVGYEGIVLGLDASADEVSVPLAYNIDVMRLLFDDEALTASQSDVGKFQTRASEKFGGVFGGMFTQPGVRAAITLAAGKPSGVTLPHLRNIVEKERGGWPNPSMEAHLSPRDYASRCVNTLFSTGLFVPTLKVHCGHCRVESYVSPDQLTATMHCEFCGRDYSLALSHALLKPEWRYRLAAHLRADQVEALLPALATTSTLRQVQATQDEPPLVLGLKLNLDHREIEVDVAAYLMEPEWVAILGEVKTGNRVDAADVANLEYLRTRLKLKAVRCVLLFATLKERFSTEEVSLLRGLVERSESVLTSNGVLVPNLPIVLTGSDLSRNFWDVEHPWRWDSGAHTGVFGTAMASCERNLGLRSASSSRAQGGASLAIDWASA